MSVREVKPNADNLENFCNQTTYQATMPRQRIVDLMSEYSAARPKRYGHLYC